MIVGIDPGQTGGIAYIDATSGTSHAMPMPLTSKQIDGHEIANALRGRSIDVVILEKVHAMPKQGVSSTFKFGMGFGLVVGVCEALGIPYRLVTPQAWKKVVLAGTAKDKDAAVTFVRRAYPSIDLTPGLKRVPHDGMADAVCLAEYGRQLMGKGAA
ncbi:MAG: Holliday junction endonuclease [Pseudomonadota bacterium]